MPIVSEAQSRQYREEGWCILERAVPPGDLELLRGRCGHFVARMDAEMDAAGTEVLGINRKGSRYFVTNCFREEPLLRGFLLGDVMADVCRGTLGPDAYLFWEQYVVKGAERGDRFGWHQDSGYVGYPEHRPYLTCWIALDDMAEINGTVHLLPFSRSGIRTWVHHVKEEGTNDMVGYFGSDPGIAAVVPAGSIVCFSSFTFHASGYNRSPRMRRAYLAQYSAEPLLTRDGTHLWGSAEPLLRGGKNVAGDPPPDIPSRHGRANAQPSIERERAGGPPGAAR